MAAIPLSDAGIRGVKRGLTARFPKDKSSHISEALAAALGFGTNMSLVSLFDRADQSDPDFALLDEQAFLDRLHAVTGRPMGSNDRSLIFDNVTYPDEAIVVRTLSIGFKRTNYTRSTRLRAWRNMLVAAINEGIDRRLFTIRPDDNRWPGAKVERDDRREPFVFRFDIGGIPAVASVYDAGYDELSIHAALWPTIDADRWIGAAWAGFLAGDAYASGWLERRTGAWLQVSTQGLKDSFSCRRHRLAEVAALSIAPKGYADRGSFKM